MTDGTSVPKDIVGAQENLVPETIFINLDQKLAIALYTIPRHANPTSLDNVSSKPDTSSGKIVVTLENNGKFKPKKYNPEDFDVSDWSIKTPIRSAQFDDFTITFDQILENRYRLIDEFFTRRMTPDERTTILAIWESAGLREGNYLYRAFTNEDMDSLKRQRF